MNEQQEDWNPAQHHAPEERYAQMAELRGRCPVAFTRRNGGFYAVLRYQDLVAVARDPETFSNAGGARYGRALPPLEYDPPAHSSYRMLLQPFFAPARIRALEPTIRESAIGLLTPLLETGGCDFAKAFSYPLPVLGLCALLQIPPSDWSNIKTWSENTLLHESDDANDHKASMESHQNIIDYAHGMIADRRAHPRDAASDITSTLLAAQVDGEPMDDDLVARTLRILISAGHNSTTSALGNCLLHLARTPADQAKLRADPTKIPAAVEEILRFETPVQEMPRWATKEVVVAGRSIPEGSRIGMMWGSGNRDGTQFDDPDRCVIERFPNRHLAFGNGIHTCIGAPMARMEVRVALEELLSRTRHFELAGEVSRPPFHRVGVESLPLRVIANERPSPPAQD